MNLENSEEKVHKTIARDILELILDLASRRMLKSLVQIRYMKESYNEDEYDKMLVAQQQICDQLLQGIFKDKEIVDESYFSQKIESYKFFQSLEQIRNCVF